MDRLYEKTAHELTGMMKRREISPVELTRSVFERIKSVEPQIGAYITLTEDSALKSAEDAEKRYAAGEGGGLLGVPYGLKDLVCTKGISTTCASKMLKDFVPPYSADVYERLSDAGAVMVGKTNLDEFAMGSTTETSYFKKTCNPYDTERVPGGSSGGSAAAVAAGEAIFSIGTDTGGSIRQPAALCGVVGLKPTYGRVSRFGVVAFASSLDQVGPITKDVTDAALVLNAISGRDERDATSLDAPVPDYTAALTGDVKGMRIGLPKEYFEWINADIKEAVLSAVKRLSDAGAIVEECSLPSTEFALASYYIISSAEACSNLARFDGVKYGLRAKDYDDLRDMYIKTRTEGFGVEVKRRIMLGAYALSSGYYDAYYKKAQQARTLLKMDFDKAFSSFDALIMPTSPKTAWRFGEVSDIKEIYAADVCTASINAAGLCGMSIPCAMNGGLPVGMQIIGPPLGEAAILRAGYAYEQAAGGIPAPKL
ncbi:MAG: Asp-tRNA(Asn)/Glu-tRNA(Gln) amidotransferase subunit GatA [Christensenellales bacterium]